MVSFFMRLVAILEALPARRRSFARLAVLSVLLLAGSSASSFADMTYTLNNGNPNISGFPSPFGSVNVSLTDSTHATITFTANTSPGLGYSYTFGDGGSMNVNVHATSWTFSGLTNNNTPADMSSGGSGNADGWGNFNQTFNTFDGFTHSFTTGSFVLQNLSGTWSSPSDVLTPNERGNSVAAHVFVALNGANTNSTGYATDGTGSPAPEPATIVILASGLPVGLLALRRRVRGYPATV
jgi:hypothetical protein